MQQNLLNKMPAKLKKKWDICYVYVLGCSATGSSVSTIYKAKDDVYIVIMIKMMNNVAETVIA